MTARLEAGCHCVTLDREANSQTESGISRPWIKVHFNNGGKCSAGVMQIRMPRLSPNRGQFVKKITILTGLKYMSYDGLPPPKIDGSHSLLSSLTARYPKLSNLSEPRSYSEHHRTELI